MIKQKLMSRKFWAAVAAAVFMIVISLASDKLTNEAAEAIKTAVNVMVAYIFGESAVDVARIFGNKKSDSDEEK